VAKVKANHFATALIKDLILPPLSMMQANPRKYIFVDVSKLKHRLYVTAATTK
jgi:hypothetical protein